MTGAQLKHSRAWNTLIQGTKLQGSKGLYTPPAYSHWYSLKTQVESNDRGTWYSYSITQERVLEESETDLFTDATEFSKFCSSGGMDQLQAPKTPAIDSKSDSNKDWED